MNTKKKNIEGEILKVAERLFVKKGYAETSTVQIAAKLGVNQALIYYYYQSKENLLKTVLERRLKRAFAALGKVVADENMSAEDVLRTVFHHHFNLCRVNADFIRFLANCLARQPRLGDFLREHIGGLIKNVFREFLERGVREGVFRKVDFDLFITTVFSLNVTPFLLNPLVRSVTAETYPDYEVFLREREAENIRIFLLLLKL